MPRNEFSSPQPSNFLLAHHYSYDQIIEKCQDEEFPYAKYQQQANDQMLEQGREHAVYACEGIAERRTFAEGPQNISSRFNSNQNVTKTRNIELFVQWRKECCSYRREENRA